MLDCCKDIISDRADLTLDLFHMAHLVRIVIHRLTIHTSHIDVEDALLDLTCIPLIVA